MRRIPIVKSANICNHLLRMICFKLLLITFLVEIVKSNYIVHTKDGLIRGKPIGSRGVTAYLGIPYAEPPMGPLRFAKPIPKGPWRGTYYADKLPPACIQAQFDNLFFVPDTTDMSEDCLFLNLWVPQTWNAYNLKPILIFFHGGMFMIGSSNMKIYDGATLAEYGDVIVATVNYRVGALGFFYGFTEDAAGNMGMYDQVLAIQWIKENAYIFGGDPENIVLMGQSAGAFSISAHLISPVSKNLFRRAILLSGSIIHPMYSDDNYRLSKLSHNYAILIGCATNYMTLENNPNGVIQCMKRLPAQYFSKADKKVFAQDLEPFSLRTGDNFLPEGTIDSYRKGNFARKDILLGLTRNEGALFLTSMVSSVFGVYGELASPYLFNENSTKQILKNFIKTGFDFVDDNIIQTYTSRVNNEEGYTYLRAMSDAVGDFIINCGAIFQADFHSLRNDHVYFYMFDYRSPSTPMAEWTDVTHFEDLPYYFGNPMHNNLTEKENLLNQNIMDILVTFIKTGNPNTVRGVMWPQYSYQDPKYLTIGERKRVEWSPELNRCEFWRRMFGSIMDDDVMRNLRDSEWAEIMGLPRWGFFPREHYPQTPFRRYGNFK